MPSITQVLADTGIIDGTWHNDEARNRGTYVAILTELHDKGSFVNLTGHIPAMDGYLDAWKAFRRDMPFDVDAIEQPCFSTVYRCGCTPDRVAHLRGEDTKTVIEVKTGLIYPWHKLQTAAQMALVDGATGRMAVYLKPNGHYRLEVHEAFAADWVAFQAALQVWHWKDKGNE